VPTKLGEVMREIKSGYHSITSSDAMLELAASGRP